MAQRALVREVSSAFADAIVREARAEPIDVDRARAQHRGYVEALRAAGVEVTVLPGEATLPDCCFVEDMAVVAGEVAVLTQCSAPARQAEQTAVAEALEAHMEIVELPAGAWLDGGDVLRLGDTFFVGLTARTSRAGAAALAEIVAQRGFATRTVEVRRALHLKCHATALPDGRVAVTRGFLDATLFDGVPGVVWLPPEEAYAANVLALESGRVLVAEGYPQTAARLADAGFDPLALPTTELAAADGSLTCLSILF